MLPRSTRPGYQLFVQASAYQFFNEAAYWNTRLLNRECNVACRIMMLASALHDIRL